MIGGPWPEEPDDPFELPGGPEVEIPSAEDAPRELAVAFWRLVVVFNVGLFALALGALLIGFRGEWARGGAVVGIGLVATAYGLWRYRAYREDPPG